jgi:hypothetical protein
MTAIHATVLQESNDDTLECYDPLTMQHHLSTLRDFLKNGIKKGDGDHVFCAKKELHEHGIFKQRIESYTPVENYSSNPPCMIL